MAAVYEIRRGFAHTRARVHAAADKAHRLRAEQRAPVCVLTHRFAACRRLYKDCRAGGGKAFGAGRFRPGLLAEFYAEGKLRQRFVPENQARPERDVLPVDPDCGIDCGRGPKMARLVVFSVSRRRLLGHNPQDLSVLHDCGGVVQAVSRAYGQAGDRNHITARARIAYAKQLFHSRCNQRLLKKEIAAGVRRYAELRGDEQGNPFARHLVHRRDNIVRVVTAVRHFHVRRDACDLNESVLHCEAVPSAPS